MKNIRELVTILQSEEPYWCIENVQEYSNFMGNTKHVSVWLVLIDDNGINRPIAESEIKLTDLQHLQRKDIQNIPISDDYAPFQHGQDLHDATNLFPVTVNPKEFLKRALNIGTNDWWTYKKLHDEMVAELQLTTSN